MSETEATGVAPETEEEPIASPSQDHEAMHKFFNETDFKLDWTNRRKVIKFTLSLIAALYSITHLAILYVFCYHVYKGNPSDPNVVYILTTCVYTDTALATSIIMSYVFGANADIKDLRSKMTSIVGSFINPKKDT